MGDLDWQISTAHRIASWITDIQKLPDGVIQESWFCAGIRIRKLEESRKE
jgi:hypothetical protein